MNLDRLLLVCLLAAPASASDLFVGSLDTSFARASPPGSAFQTLGACGGQVAAITGEGGEVYVATTSGTVYLHRSDSQQTVIWATLNAVVPTGIALRGHEVLVATTSSKVLALDRSRGTLLREWLTPSVPTTLTVDRGEAFAGTSFGAVMRLEDDGSVGFLGTCGSTIAGIGASANELFLASSGGFVWRVDRATGFVTTFFVVPEELTGIVYDQGRLYAASASGNLRIYDAATEHLITSQAWSSAIQSLSIGAAAAGDAYCFGESNLCPCGASDAFGGCPSWVGLGARLVTYGSASVASDDLELAVLDLPPTTIGRFYMGAGVAQVPFGNGLLCAGAGGYGQFRFPVEHAQSSQGFGAFRFGPDIVAHSAQHFGALGTIQPGSTWRFQAWFRDVQNPCGGGFNTSNASSVTFQP